MSIVTLEEFSSIDFESPILYLETLDCMKIGNYYKKASLEFKQNGHSTEERIYNLLYIALNRIYLNLRSNISDMPFIATGHPDTLEGMMDKLKGKQAIVFSSIIPFIRHPSLKARLAEIVFTNDRQRKDMVKVAISSYCKSIEWSLDGKAVFSSGDKLDENYLICQILNRACFLSDYIGWKGEEALTVQSLILDLYHDINDEMNFYMFNEIARVALNFSVVDADKIFKDSEVMINGWKNYLKDEMTQLCEDAKNKSDAQKKERD